MSPYFSDYPKITITNPIDNSSSEIVDIFRRIKFNEDLSKHQNLYTNYYVKDGERPEQIAHNYYGDKKYYWIILLLNNIENDNWVKSDNEIEKILYNIPNQNAVKYYKTLEIKNSEGIIILQKNLIVDINFNITVDGILYNNLNAYTPITIREDIIEKNEKKRNIILLDPGLVSKLDDDFTRLIKYQTSNLTNNGTKFEEI